MILDSPFTADLGKGADRAIVQEGDSQLVIPAVGMPTVEFLQAHSQSNNITDRATQSKLASSIFSRTNLPSLNQDLIVLPKGLYTLQWMIAARFNFTNAVIDGFILNLSYQNFGQELAALLTGVGSFSLYGETRLLLTSDGLLHLDVCATNAVATNSIQSIVSVNVIRHL